MIERTRALVEADEVAFFDKYYQSRAYNELGWRLRIDREVNNILRVAGGRKIGRVLSLGCGDGQFEIALAPHVGHVTALDISTQAIELARRQMAVAGINNIDFRCQPLSELEWSTGFDTVVCLAFLHHLRPSDLPGILSTAGRALAPGGFFYSQDPNALGALRWLGRRTIGKNYHKYHSPDEREISPAELEAELHAAGFGQVHLGYIDVTLIPALFILRDGPSWPLRLCRPVDWLWCHSPVARWASGFFSVARR